MPGKWIIACTAIGLSFVVIAGVVVEGTYTVGEGLLVAGFTAFAISLIAAFGIGGGGWGGGDGGGGWFGGDGGGGCGG